MKKLLIVLGVLLLSGCGTATETVHFVQPNQPGARLCTIQCREAEDFCTQGCGLDERSCVNAMQAQAIKDYDAYVRGQMVNHAAIDLRPRDFERPAQCPTSSCKQNCEKTYRVCFVSCGGKVEVETSCQFMCF